MGIELLLLMTLGFLGSFGHCVGMCGPLALAFSLTHREQSRWRSLLDQSCFNLGRVCSYGAIGALLGGAGSLVIAGGQLAGIGSPLRQTITVLTGFLLIWLGLVQLKFIPMPQLKLGFLAHHRLNQFIGGIATNRWWSPLLLGSVWGLMPCGFLYIAQIKAAESGDWLNGLLIMLAFGLGTSPMMLGVGLLANRLGSDRRTQLFRLSGWVMLGMGVLALSRTDRMVDYSGHLALMLLALALLARPISRLWPQPLQFRRLLGVGAMIMTLAHTGYMLNHSLNWNVRAIAFMLPQHRLGMGLGIGALLLMLPAALTSTDRLQQRLGSRWRSLHLLSVPALLCAGLHAILIGSHYLGGLEQQHWLMAIGLGLAVLMVLCVRQRWTWSLLSLNRFYVPPAAKPHR